MVTPLAITLAEALLVGVVIWLIAVFLGTFLFIRAAMKAEAREMERSR